MSLSAAVSACCTVWKSSVMAYLMVIVQGGERLPCLHAAICRVRSGGLGGSGGKTGGRWRDFTLGFFFFFLSADFLHLGKQVVYGTTRHRRYLKQIMHFYMSFTSQGGSWRDVCLFSINPSYLAFPGLISQDPFISHSSA